ncbi:MFS-type transporter SLC18B1-like [Saccostrea echinata]|uniref:MFS-type transporter SLC18B1-like n=1 Tax=Saccostrea echinata TaxID=191078 RepID=UPI002A7F1F8B|nr:MFS-type transporter SLC18B1-like [Saccostrea echinata]
MTETDETSYILSSVTYDRKYSCIGGEEKKCQQSQNAQQSGPSGDETNPTMSYREAPRHRKLLLVSLALVDFFGYASFSMLAPFFPAEAEKKGASQIVVGVIFGIFELTIFLVSPIIGSFITKIGAKRTYLSGCMLAGACSIAFGLLDKCQGGLCSLY